MAIGRTQAVVIGRRDLGESDRVVDFFTAEFGKLRGVAKRARRPRSRFGSALELLTLGELVFFDNGRSELVQVDHFDILEPFLAVREHLERLGHGAWAVECVGRLSADRDPHAALFRLLVRDLRALAHSARPGWISCCFALRAVDLLGHRPRIEACVRCGRAYPFAPAALDVEGGGLACERCATPDLVPVSGAAVGALRRLRRVRWEEAIRLKPTPALERELAALVERSVATLAGQRPRSSRFLGQLRRSLLRVAEPPAPRVR
jgi:DNA repair protein RecO (recombination protein O)